MNTLHVLMLVGIAGEGFLVGMFYRRKQWTMAALAATSCVSLIFIASHT